MQQKSLNKSAVFLFKIENVKEKNIFRKEFQQIISNALQIVRSSEHNPKQHLEYGTRNCTYFLSSTAHVFACTAYHSLL